MQNIDKIIITLNELPKVWRKKIRIFLDLLKVQNIEDFDESINYFNYCASNWQIKWLKSSFDEKIISESKYRCTKIIEESEKLWIKITTLYDEDYPEKLRRLNDYPVILYSKWPFIELHKRKVVTVIWTREATKEWEKAAERLWNKFSKSWFNIVSWLAKWCDTAAHKWALLSNNWITTAILWSWLDSIYPQENRYLADKILDNWWLLLSEYPLWIEYNKWTLVDRDRIQAWIADLLIWVQFWINSWTVYAIDEGINIWVPVFVVKFNNEWELWDKISWNREYLNLWKAKEIISTNVDDIINSI